MRTRVASLTVVFVGVVVAGLRVPSIAAAPTPLRVVAEVDYQRYAGRWFEVARLPNRFERKCASDVTATYTPRPDGRITVANRCLAIDGRVRTAEGVAQRAAGRPPGMLEVRFAPAWLGFLPVVWGDYQIIALDPDYRDVLVGAPDRAYLWVLSRTPKMDPARYRALLDEAQAQGFDVSAVVEIRHSAS